MDHKTLLLNKTDVGSLVDLDAVQAAVEDGYRSFQKGLVSQPDFIDLHRPGGDGGMDVKAGVDAGSGRMSIKASSGGYKFNPEKGLPTGINLVTLYDADTSAVLCVMDGTYITGCRTAAAGAISVKYMARKDASKIAILGAGNQGRRQLRAIARVRDLTDVYVWSFHEESEKQYVEEMGKELGLTMHPCKTPEEAVRNADIVVTTTHGYRGFVVEKAWLKPGTHIAAIGTDTPGKEEVAPDVMASARVICDSINFCKARGDMQHPLKLGLMHLEDIAGEIGEVILGEKPGRENDEQITVFDTVGMPIQDVAMANAIYQGALEKGIGTWYDFMG